MGRSQVVRQRILIPPFGGSNPPVPANQFRYLQPASGHFSTFRTRDFSTRAPASFLSTAFVAGSDRSIRSPAWHTIAPDLRSCSAPSPASFSRPRSSRTSHSRATSPVSRSLLRLLLTRSALRRRADIRLRRRPVASDPNTQATITAESARTYVCRCTSAGPHWLRIGLWVSVSCRHWKMDTLLR